MYRNIPEAQRQTVRESLTALLALESGVSAAMAAQRPVVGTHPGVAGLVDRVQETAERQRDALAACLERMDGAPPGEEARRRVMLPFAGELPAGGLPVTTAAAHIYGALHLMALHYGALWLIDHRAHTQRVEEPLFRLAEHHQRRYLELAQELAALTADVVAWELLEHDQPCQCPCNMCRGLGACLCIAASREITVDALRETVVGAEGGVRLSQVRDGSPAARAGLRPDDVVVAVEGQGVAAAYQTPSVIAFLKPISLGQPVSVRVRRAGGAEEISVAP